MRERQFDKLSASTLYCTECKAAMPVRERLLLVLPGKELYGYFCSKCGNSLGEREVVEGDGNGGGDTGGIIF